MIKKSNNVVIIKMKGAQVVLSRYSGNPVEALIHLFPEIGLDQSKFIHPSGILLLFSYLIIFF